MKVIKNDSQFGPIIIFAKDNKFLRFTFGSNGDLYWSIHLKNSNTEKTFTITKKLWCI